MIGVLFHAAQSYTRSTMKSNHLSACILLFLLFLLTGTTLKAQLQWTSIPEPQFPDEGLAQRPIVNGPADRVQARPRLRIRPLMSSGPQGRSPSQIRHAYGFDQLTATGSGQIIGIVDAYGSPTIQNDLNAFCKQYRTACHNGQNLLPPGCTTGKQRLGA